ncbi:hypothetical protein LZC95_52990 [Pendulispora brunnea]|uniref:Uncharacterized protein n=1 Tax=Pendulispora brunnea TaxID=2905690 RepID=A0ABZ2K8X5_9BACT
MNPRAPFLLFGASSLLWALGAGACASNDHIVVEPVVVGMTRELPPLYDDGEARIYQVGTPVRLPIRRTPGIVAGDLQIEVRFTISNLDDQKHSVELLVDPWNEFVRYKPGIQVVNEEQVTPDFSGFDKFFIVGPKSRVEGIITPDDTVELATDLATAQAVVAAPPANANVNGILNRIFNLQNRSSVFDPVISPLIPKTIPAMIGFDLGLRTYEPGNVSVEVIVDVIDLHGKDYVVTSGDTSGTFDAPGAELVPPKP